MSARGTQPGRAAALAPRAVRVGIYCRISEDPRKKEEGVARQEKDGRALAALRGWDVHEVYVDNDISALKGATRPAYDRLLLAVARGEVTHVIAYGLSRLWRNRRERAEAIELFGRHRVSVTLVKGGELDLSSAAGRAVAGLMGEMDTMESEIKGERVARAALDRAEQGRAHAHVAYGWHRVYHRDASGAVLAWHDEEDPAQAKIVREIVERLLDHESIKAITTDLNERGVTPPRAALRALNGAEAGTPYTPQVWRPSTVRKIALRDANVAIVSRGRQRFGDAAWPAIVDRDKHEQVVALLTDPSRATSNSGARRHLLTYGIGQCGLCGGVLRAKVYSGTARRARGGAAYVCDAKGCTSRRQEDVDRLVEKTVVRRLARPDAAELLARDDTSAREARERAATLRARLAQTQDDYDADLITRDQYLRSTQRHRAALAEAEQEATRAVRGVAPELVARLAGPQAEAEWQALDTGQRRALLEAMGVVVKILPTKPGPGFRPESVVVAFGGEVSVGSVSA